MPPLLEVQDLTVRFRTMGLARQLLTASPQPFVEAVAGVSFEVAPASTLALVGESGSGKTTLGRALIGLVPPSAGRVRYQAQPQGHHARGGAKVVEFPAARYRRAGEEARQHVVPHRVEPVDAGAYSDVGVARGCRWGVEQDLQVTRGDHTHMDPPNRMPVGRKSIRQCLHGAPYAL